MPPASPERLSLKPKNNFNMGKSSIEMIKDDSAASAVEMLVDEINQAADDKENDLPELLPGDHFQSVSPDDMLVVSMSAGPDEPKCQEVVCVSSSGSTSTQQQQQQHQEIILQNRCSYEEMIHIQEVVSLQDSNDKTMIDQCDDIITSALVTLTQWALILQEVYEDQCTNGLKPSVNKCQCSKASFLEKELKGVQNNLKNVEGESLIDLGDMAKLLRSHVSIQISRPSPEIADKSHYLVSSSVNTTAYTDDVINSLIRLIQDICQVNNCKHCVLDSSDSIESEDSSQNGVVEQDEEEEMSNRVASVSTCSQSPPRNRKRKQILPKSTSSSSSTFASKSPPHSPTSSPSKKPRKGRSLSLGGGCGGNNVSNPFHVRPFHKTNVIDILEKNKKMVKANGLYQFVLWREALKAEKDRAVTKNNTKRLSFD